METTIVDTSFKSEEYFINMGPQHPATHGVLRLLLTIDGEIIKKVEPDLGYIHRSIEKMCERDSYQQIVHLTDRMDYLSSHINNEAVCLTVENALQLEIPERVKVVRTIIGELTRIASHCLWWGVMGMDVGALTTYFYGFRDREMINDIFEETCGARLTMNYNVPGGLMWDIHPNFVKRTKEFVTHFKTKIPEYDRLLTGNIIFQKRTKGVGVLSKEDAISFGASGPVGRGSGYSCDVRKYQIDNIPDGEHRVATNAVIKLPKGEYYQKVETARGELGVYIISTGTKNPYRLKFRSPGFSNLSLLNHISVGGKIGDLVATMATLDLVIPDIDR
ncbi:MAG: NADH-quinone oxidoreductase subunit D [Flavobacteriaceae bacterium]